MSYWFIKIYANDTMTKTNIQVNPVYLYDKQNCDASRHFKKTVKNNKFKLSS